MARLRWKDADKKCLGINSKSHIIYHIYITPMATYMLIIYNCRLCELRAAGWNSWYLVSDLSHDTELRLFSEWIWMARRTKKNVLENVFFYISAQKIVASTTSSWWKRTSKFVTCYSWILGICIDMETWIELETSWVSCLIFLIP